MAMNEVVRFCTEYLPNHPEFKQTIDARGDERSAALAALGKKAGFDFSADEVRAVLAASPSGELSDDALKGVAGGKVESSRLLKEQVRLAQRALEAYKMAG